MIIFFFALFLSSCGLSARQVILALGGLHPGICSMKACSVNMACVLCFRCFQWSYTHIVPGYIYLYALIRCSRCLVWMCTCRNILKSLIARLNAQAEVNGRFPFLVSGRSVPPRAISSGIWPITVSPAPLCCLATQLQQAHTDLSVNWSHFAYLPAVSLSCKWSEIQSWVPGSGEGLAPNSRLTAC